MKTYLRLLKFARPIKKYSIPYSLYVILHVVFNTLNFVLIMPIVKTLFSGNQMLEVVQTAPVFDIRHIDTYFREMINYLVYRVYGTEYDVIEILIMLTCIIVVSAFLSNLFRYLSQRTMETLRIHTMKQMRNAVFKNVMHLHAGFFSNERKGDIISKITSDIQVVQFTITNTLQVAVRDPLIIIGYITVLVVLSWKLTLFVLVVLPVIAFVIGIIVKNLRKSAKAAQESFADMVTVTDEALGGVKILKGYNAVTYIINKFFSLNDRYSRIMKSMANRQQMASPMSEFLGISAIGIVLIYGGGLVLGGGLSAEAFLGYLAIFSQLTRPVRQFMDAFSNIHQGIAAGERVLELIDTKSEIQNVEHPAYLDSFNQGIEFRNVFFSYEEKEILNNVSFSIEKGETVALVGPSGGGKSTISDLIPRFYDPSSGEVQIDGKNIKLYDIESVRSHMGIVAQDTVLFNDTIENNIKLGKLEASHEQVVAAAKIANAHEFIMGTEQGYETNVGDRGMKLSGGQRQRLSIARAILKNPDILILDEATSALDTESEKLVQGALNNLLEGRTSLVIAHRLSTIQHADKIIVVDQGRIVETGTHQQLLKLEGVYKKLIDMQQLDQNKD